MSASITVVLRVSTNGTGQTPRAHFVEMGATGTWRWRQCRVGVRMRNLQLGTADRFGVQSDDKRLFDKTGRWQISIFHYQKLHEEDLIGRKREAGGRRVSSLSASVIGCAGIWRNKNISTTIISTGCFCQVIKMLEMMAAACPFPPVGYRCNR